MLQIIPKNIFAYTLIIFSTNAYSAYVITDLGIFGGISSSAQDINNLGVVAGDVAITGGPGGTSSGYIHDGLTTQLLSATGDRRTTASGINSSGQISGYSTGANNSAAAFIWTAGVRQSLNASANDSFANDINDSGVVVGSVRNGSLQATVWDNGNEIALGTFGGTTSEAYGINNSGQVVGYADLANNYDRAFIYSNGTMHELGTLAIDGVHSRAWDINDSGQVVGRANYGNGFSGHAFLWENGVMQDLDTLSDDSTAFGINNSGQVVGIYSDSANNLLKAFIWDNGLMSDLCVLTDCQSNGWDYLRFANAINDNGDIVGTGYKSGVSHSFLISLTPVPIPPAIWLFGSGLIGLVGAAKRINRG